MNNVREQAFDRNGNWNAEAYLIKEPCGLPSFRKIIKHKMETKYNPHLFWIV